MEPDGSLACSLVPVLSEINPILFIYDPLEYYTLIYAKDSF
jgi:hypothetical protein